MVDKSSAYSNMTVTLKPLTLTAVGNEGKMLRIKFFVVSKCLQEEPNTINCRDSPFIKCPGFARRMLTAGIDSHVIRHKFLRRSKGRGAGPDNLNTNTDRYCVTLLPAADTDDD